MMELLSIAVRVAGVCLRTAYECLFNNAQAVVMSAVSGRPHIDPRWATPAHMIPHKTLGSVLIHLSPTSIELLTF